MTIEQIYITGSQMCLVAELLAWRKHQNPTGG